MYDVLVIGGGVIGCAIARELSRRSGRICVVERNEDVCTGTSKANSATPDSMPSPAAGRPASTWRAAA